MSNKPHMSNKMVARGAMVGMLFVAFVIGYACGSLTTPRASAQLPQLPGGLTGGGPLANVEQFASSVTEMEQHVSGLQKNLDTFKKVQSALTGK